MAADQTNIVIDACLQASVQATIILDALLELEKVKNEIASLGADISTYSVAIEANDQIKHCDAATFKNLIDSFSTSMVTSLKALYDGIPTQQCWNALQIARKIS
jgi:hypothetical protein